MLPKKSAKVMVLAIVLIALRLVKEIAKVCGIPIQGA